MENQQSMQEQYLANIKQIIEANIGNESFSVSDLAREAGLSRSMLHRKLIRLTGKSATDLITEIRLTKALELLENDAGTVSEIAYKVGYSSPSYFNKVFKKTYKVSAGDVRRKGSGKISHLRVIKEPGDPDSAKSARSARSRSKVIAGTNILMIILVTLGAVALILGLMDKVSPFSRFPEWTTNLILVILIVGLIIAVILYWFYNIRPERGIAKTEPADKVKPEDKPTSSNRWKVARYISFVVIVGLIVLNVMVRSDRIRPEDIQVLLVLPPENYTGDDSLDIVISGMHYLLIADLGRISGWKVICKTTSDVYKDTNMTLSQIASERGVNAIIEPAVMCFGDSICIAINMITPDEKQIMFAEYREAKGQILNIYNRLTKKVSDAVKNKLSPDEKLLLAESRTADPDALDAYIKGLDYWEKVTREDWDTAKQYFERAIEIDPDWGPPYAGMASIWLVGVFFEHIPQDEGLPEVYKYLDKAVELDPNSANTHYTEAMIAAWLEWDWLTAEREYVKSLELNPSDALCHMYYSHMLMCNRRFDEALYQAQLGLELDPERPLVLGLYGVVMRCQGDYQSAIEHFEKALSIDPDFDFAKFHLFYCELLAGDYESWIPKFKEYSCWDDTVKTSFERTIYEDGLVPAIERLLEHNDKYASPSYCFIGIGLQLFCSIIVNDFDRALDCFEKIYEDRGGDNAYIASNLMGDYDQLIEYPRYIELLKKINLPLPED